MNVWGLPLAGFAWSFCPHKPPAIHLSQIRLSCPVTGSHSQLLPVSLWTCSHDSLYSPISSLGGSSFPCVPSLSYRCKKNCWFFTLVSFLRVKAEQWHLSSSRIEPEKWKFYRVSFYINCLCLCLPVSLHHHSVQKVHVSGWWLSTNKKGCLSWKTSLAGP